MSEAYNDKTQSPNFQGGAYDFRNKSQPKPDAVKEGFGADGKRPNQPAKIPGEDKDDSERIKRYENHRNQEPQTHDYARSMDHGRNPAEDEKRDPGAPRNQQVPYAPHDSRGESKVSPSVSQPDGEGRSTD